ncbi:MAG TPA: transaldolase family protein [Ktedonobacterales bacterium]|nr:transaldolase family protein [Ktedonobacterales bacterium]
MALLVDSAWLEDVTQICRDFPVRGVTTNPTIVLEAVERGQRLALDDLARQLLASCSGPVFLQPVADGADELVVVGRASMAIDPARIVLKLPMTAEGMRAGKTLSGEGARIAYTAVYTLPQAYSGLLAGAEWIIPYFGRLRRAGLDACDRIGEMARLLRTQRAETRLLVASLKSPDDVIEATLAGAHDIAAQPNVIRGLLQSPLTNDALAGFSRDWQTVQQALQQR